MVMSNPRVLAVPGEEIVRHVRLMKQTMGVGATHVALQWAGCIGMAFVDRLEATLQLLEKLTGQPREFTRVRIWSA